MKLKRKSALEFYHDVQFASEAFSLINNTLRPQPPVGFWWNYESNLSLSIRHETQVKLRQNINRLRIELEYSIKEIL